MSPPRPTTPRGWLRRVAPRAAKYTGEAIAALVVLAILAVGAAAVFLQGERLARLVSSRLPELGGKLEFRTINWSAGLVPALLTDAPTTVRLEGVRVRDPEGTVVLEAPVLEMKIAPRSAMAGHVKLIELTMGPGSSWRFASMKNKQIGFLAALVPVPDPKRPRLPPDPTAKVQPFTFELVRARLDGLTATFDFPGAWGLELRDCQGEASFELIVAQNAAVFFDVTNLHARRGGYLRVIEDVLPFDDVQVARVATTRERPADIFLDVSAGRTGRSTLVGKGFFTHIYDDGLPGIDMRAELRDAADALAAVAARRGIEGLVLGGTGALVTLSLHEPFERIGIDGRLTGLDVTYGGRRALGLGTGLKFSGADPLTIELPDLSFGAPGGGRFEAAVKLSGTKLQVGVHLARLATTSYVPAPMVRSLGGTVDGGFTLRGDLERRSAELDVRGLTLSRSASAGLPRVIGVRGLASANAQKVSTSGLTITVPGASARVTGEFALARQLLSLGLHATAEDLPRVLAPFGVPPIARRAELAATIAGTLRDPKVVADARIVGVGLGLRTGDGAAASGEPLVPELRAHLTYQDGTARLTSMEGAAFGGTLRAEGDVQVARGTLDRLLRHPTVRVQIDGVDLSLESLLAQSMVTGRLSFRASAEGPIDALAGRLILPPGAELVVLGERWKLDGIDVEVTPAKVHVKTARLQRRDGGEVSLEGDLFRTGEKGVRKPNDLAMNLKIRDFPVEALPGVSDAGVPITGRLSVDLAFTGPAAAPSVGGRVDVDRVVVRGAPMGGVHLTLSPVPSGTRVEGRVFDRLDLVASATMAAAGPDVKARLSFRELAIEELLPEFQTVGHGRGRVTGRVDLELSPGRPPRVEVRLDQLAMSIARVTEDEQGRKTTRPLDIRSAAAIHATWQGESLHLDPMRLLTNGGLLEVRGDLKGRAIDARATGHLDLELLHAFAWRQLERLTGDVAVDLAVSGTLDQPRLIGGITVKAPILVRPRAVALDLRVPSGSLRLDGDRVRLEDLVVAIDDAQLRLRGDTQVDARFVPKALSVDVSGEVPARLLELIAPEAVAESSGKLAVEGHFRGPIGALDARARVEVRAVHLRLRDFAGDIGIKTGIVELTSQQLTVRNLVATIDDEGELRIGAGNEPPGTIHIVRLLPTPEIGRIHLPLRGERLRYRAPNLVEIDDLGLALNLDGSPAEGLTLAGDVRIVSGRYVQDFTVRNLALSPRVEERSSRSVYEGRPLLANLALDFRVRTVGDTFYVQNNLAPQLHMIVDLAVGGTLSRPTLDGSVRPTDGRFRILGLRGDFELVPNVNYVTFVPTKSLQDGQTPEVNLEAISLMTDSNGIDHNVRMTIRGPIGQAAIDLRTDRGLDRNQTLLLLLSGRGSDGFAQLNTSRNSTVGANVSSGTELIGQLSRDTVSNLVEPYIDDALQAITGRKLNLRPTIGADGFELRLVALPSRQLRLQLMYLRGFQAQTRARAEGSLWLADYLSLRGFGEQLTVQPQQGLTERVNSLNLEMTLDFPLRLPLP